MYNDDFDSKAKTWDSSEKIYRAQLLADLISKESADLKLDSAFEYGCGTGLVSLQLQNKITKITLADISEGMLDILNEKIAAQQITNMFPLNLDLMLNQPLNKTFTLAYSLLTLHHIQNTQHIFSAFYNILKKNGRLFIADLDQEDGSFHGTGFDGHNGFIREDLKHLAIKVGFKNIKFREFYSITKTTAAGENKTYPLFLMIADK